MSLKKQHFMRLLARLQRQKLLLLTEMANPFPGPRKQVVIEFDLSIMTAPDLPSASLTNAVQDNLAVIGRPLALTQQIAQVAHWFIDALKTRNEILAMWKEAGGSTANPDFVYHYLGIPHPSYAAKLVTGLGKEGGVSVAV